VELDALGCQNGRQPLFRRSQLIQGLFAEALQLSAPSGIFLQLGQLFTDFAGYFCVGADVSNSLSAGWLPSEAHFET
jgi:hypothetical protein